MSVGQHESIAIDPFGISRIVFQHGPPQHLGNICQTHGRARVSAVGRLDGIHRECPDRIRPIYPG